MTAADESKRLGGKPVTLARNFLDCIKSRATCSSDIENAHRNTSATLIANNAMQTQSYLEWDAKAEKFTNQPAADKLLRYDYRPPFKFPESKAGV
jgi:hypothetical protein